MAGLRPSPTRCNSLVTTRGITTATIRRLRCPMATASSLPTTSSRSRRSSSSGEPRTVLRTSIRRTRGLIRALSVCSTFAGRPTLRGPAKNGVHLIARVSGDHTSCAIGNPTEAGLPRANIDTGLTNPSGCSLQREPVLWQRNAYNDEESLLDDWLFARRVTHELVFRPGVQLAAPGAEPHALTGGAAVLSRLPARPARFLRRFGHRVEQVGECAQLSARYQTSSRGVYACAMLSEQTS